MSFKTFTTTPSRAHGATARATASSTRIGQKSARPAAARNRGATRAHARDDAPASEGRTVDALNKLSSLYESESERDERIRATQRERDAMEGLGLADAFKTAKRGSKTRRDFARKRTYGVTRTSFGAVVELGCAAEVVYGYWTTPAALAETLPELEKCEAAADGGCAYLDLESAQTWGRLGRLGGGEPADGRREEGRQEQMRPETTGEQEPEKRSDVT